MEIKKFIPRKNCTIERLRALRSLGYKTSGYYPRLEVLLQELDYDLPFETVLNAETYFGFCIDGRQWYEMNYADACAEKILFIHKYNKFKRSLINENSQSKPVDIIHINLYGSRIPDMDVD